MHLDRTTIYAKKIRGIFYHWTTFSTWKCVNPMIRPSDNDDDGDDCKDGVLACTAPIGVTSQPDYRDTAQA